jgi:type IV secretory pathway VirB2 component (pilin)
MLSLMKQRSFLVRIAIAALVMVAATIHGNVALAAGGGGGVLNFTQLTNALADVENFLSGPLAKFLALFSVVVGAIMFFQGREMSEGLKVFGVIAMTIGILVAGVGFFPAFGATI